MRLLIYAVLLTGLIIIGLALVLCNRMMPKLGGCFIRDLAKKMIGILLIRCLWSGRGARLRLFFWCFFSYRSLSLTFLYSWVRVNDKYLNIIKYVEFLL